MFMLMKRKVHYSWYCIVITFVVMAAFCIGIVTVRGDAHSFPLLVVMTVVATFTGFFYCPVSVRADSDGVRVCRLMSRARVFPYSDMESVETCYPSAGGIRLCGSGGFFGYWGYFSDIMIGQYFGYYADRGQCFCIRLRSGRQYVVSCDDHVEMVRLIRERI